MFTHNTQIKKTRTPHKCFYCKRTIEPGESAEKCFTADGGTAFSHYMCDWCCEYVADLENEDGWGFFEYSEGGLPERVSEVLRGYQCPHCGGKDISFSIDTKRNMIYLECNDYIIDESQRPIEPCGNKWEVSLTYTLELEREVPA